MNEPTAMLQEIRDHADVPATPEAIKWFQQGVNKFMSGASSLDEALGLKIERVKYHLLCQRNEHLVAAWLALPGDLSPWPRSVELANRVSIFLDQIWRDIQHNDLSPECLNPVDKQIYYALEIGIGLPSGERQLNRICASDIDSDHDVGDKATNVDLCLTKVKGEIHGKI